MTKAAARAALKALIATIDGTGSYVTDFGGRVYDRLLLGKHEAGPYVCMPLLDEQVRYEHMDCAVKVTWSETIHVFCAEDAAAVTACSAAAVLAAAHDDIVMRALLSDLRLGGAVHEMSVVGANTWTGEDEGEDYGEMQIRVDLTIVGDATS